MTLLWLFLIIKHLIRIICVKDRFVFSSRLIFLMQPRQINFYLKRDKICFRKNIGFILNLPSFIKRSSRSSPPVFRIIIIHRIISIVLFGSPGCLPSALNSLNIFLLISFIVLPNNNSNRKTYSAN